MNDFSEGTNVVDVASVRNRLSKTVCKQVDLESVISIRNFFAAMRGKAASKKIIMDHALHRRVGTLLEAWNVLASSDAADDMLLLQAIGLTKAEVDAIQDVYDNPVQWGRSTPDILALYSALEGYSLSNVSGNIDSDAWNFASENLRTRFGGVGFQRMKPLQWEEIPYHGTKSAGFPMMGEKDKDLDRAMREVHKMLKSGKIVSPCVGGNRVQQKAGGSKTRLVFMYPFSVTLLEGKFAPLVTSRISDHIREVTYEDGMQGIAVRTHNARSMQYVVETDFSQFDASISAELISLCFEILSECFDLSDETDKQSWDLMVDFFINTPILMEDGLVYMTNKGVPSGSWFTNIIDSMVNIFCVDYCTIRGNVKGAVHMNVLGDDALLGFTSEPSLEQWSLHAAEIGLIVSPEKSKVARPGAKRTDADYSDLPYYLGHFWSSEGIWLRPLHLTLARLIYHERFVNMDQDLLRLSRLASHSMDNPTASDIIFQILVGDPSVTLDHDSDPTRDELVMMFYQYGRKTNVITGHDHLIQTAPVTGRQELMRAINGTDEFSFNIQSYRSNVWYGANIPDLPFVEP